MTPKRNLMRANKMQEGWIKTALRLPPELHRDVHEEAKRQDRTFNGQIVATLRQATPAPSQKSQGAQQ